MNVKTVFQFSYMLKRSHLKVGQVVKELNSNEIDIPVFIVSKEQLAGFEKYTSLSEISNTCLKALKISYPDDWLKEELNKLAKKGILQCSRGCYKTIHREWARKYIISYSSFSDETKKTAKTLLSATFDPNYDPEELLRLWSWLPKSLFFPFLAKYDEKAWNSLISNILKTKLFNLGFFSYNFHLMFNDDSRDIFVLNAFKNNQTPILEHIHQANQNDWWSFKEIFCMLKHIDKDYTGSLINSIDPNLIASLLNNSSPSTYGNVTWFFSSTREANIEWTKAVGEKINWEAIVKKIVNYETVDLSVFQNIFKILSTIDFKIKLSNYKILFDIFMDKIINSRISNIHGDFFWHKWVFILFQIFVLQ